MTISSMEANHHVSPENDSPPCSQQEEQSLSETEESNSSSSSGSSQSEEEMKAMTAGLFDTFMEIGNYIGGGTFGHVYTANFRDDTSKEVVVKFVKRTSQQSEMEAILMTKLGHHPNIIECIDFFRNRDYVQIITKSHGAAVINFRKYLQCVPSLTENICRFFFQQISSAVSFIHQNEMAHLDLKPENLIINSDLQIKIIDFGLARDLQKDGNGPFLGNCGTRGFMAPEMLIQKSYFAKESDIWALGVIFFESFFYTLPYKVSKDYEFIVPPKHPLMEMKTPFSLDFKTFLEGMLCIDIDQRFTMDCVLNHRWFKGSSHFDTDAYNPFIQDTSSESTEAENVTKTISNPTVVTQTEQRDDFLVLCGEQQDDDSSPPDWLSSDPHDNSSSPPQWLLCDPNQVNALPPPQLVSCAQEILAESTPDHTVGANSREIPTNTHAGVAEHQHDTDTLGSDVTDKQKESLFTMPNIKFGIAFAFNIALNAYHGGLGRNAFLFL